MINITQLLQVDDTQAEASHSIDIYKIDIYSESEQKIWQEEVNTCPQIWK